MLASSFLSLLGLGGVSWLSAKLHYDRILSFLVLIAVSFISFNLYQSWQAKEFQDIIYAWISSRHHHLDFRFTLNNESFMLLAPLFLISCISILYNIIYPTENNRLKLNSLLVLNMAFLISLVCSQNLIQLMLSFSFINIIAFCIINNMSAKKKFMFYNLLADMGLFMLFAVIYGQVSSMRISALADYVEKGRHKDLVVCLLLLCVFIKSALFMFQSSFLDVSQISFNRQLALSFVSTPIVGVLIFYKLHDLLKISSYTMPILYSFAALSILWGMVGAVVKDNIKQKATYLNIMLRSLFFVLVFMSYKNFLEIFPVLAVIFFLLQACLLMIVVCASNENLVSNMGSFIKAAKFTFILTLFVVLAEIQTVFRVFELVPEAKYWLIGFMSAYLISLSSLLRGVYLRNTYINERVWALLKNPSFLYWLPVAIFTGLILWVNASHTVSYLWLSGFFALFILLLLTGPFRYFDSWYESEFVQDYDIFQTIYTVFIITPLQILGRVLWLTIDFLFIEKTVLNSINHFNGFTAIFFKKFNDYNRLSYFIFSLIGLGIIFWCFYGGLHK